MTVALGLRVEMAPPTDRVPADPPDLLSLAHARAAFLSLEALDRFLMNHPTSDPALLAAAVRDVEQRARAIAARLEE